MIVHRKIKNPRALPRNFLSAPWGSKRHWGKLKTTRLNGLMTCHYQVFLRASGSLRPSRAQGSPLKLTNRSNSQKRSGIKPKYGNKSLPIHAFKWSRKCPLTFKLVGQRQVKKSSIKTSAMSHMTKWGNTIYLATRTHASEIWTPRSYIQTRLSKKVNSRTTSSSWWLN